MTNLKDYFEINNFITKEENEYLLSFVNGKILEQSNVFNIQKKENVYDKNVRSSKRVKICDNNLFDFIENKVKINGYVFKVIKNDIEYIEYDKNDYFKPHQDFENYVSNFYKMYSMLIYLNDDYENGKTIIHVNKSENHETVFNSDNYNSFKFGTKNNALLFKNELVHECKNITNGIKKVLKVNFIGYENKINNELVIEFESYSNVYIIPMEIAMKSSYLSANYNFNLNSGSKNPNVIKIENYSYSDFKVIYDLLCNKEINYSQCDQDIIKYFGIDPAIVSIISSAHEQISLIDKRIINFNNMLATYGTFYICNDKAEFDNLKHILSNKKSINEIIIVKHKNKKQNHINMTFCKLKNIILNPQLHDKSQEDMLNQIYYSKNMKTDDDFDELVNNVGKSFEQNIVTTDHLKLITFFAKIEDNIPSYGGLNEILDINNVDLFVNRYISAISSITEKIYDEYAPSCGYDFATDSDNDDEYNTKSLLTGSKNKAVINFKEYIDLCKKVNEIKFYNFQHHHKDSIEFAYNCNETNYFKEEINIYFGFLNYDVDKLVVK